MSATKYAVNKVDMASDVVNSVDEFKQQLVRRCDLIEEFQSPVTLNTSGQLWKPYLVLWRWSFFRPPSPKNNEEEGSCESRA